MIAHCWQCYFLVTHVIKFLTGHIDHLGETKTTNHIDIYINNVPRQFSEEKEIFPTNRTEITDYQKKKNLNSYILHYTKINLKWIIELN